MNLFKKLKREVMPAIRTAWSGKAANRLEQVQSRVAVYLNGRTANFSAKGKWLFLVVICLLLGGCSLYLLIRAFI